MPKVMKKQEMRAEKSSPSEGVSGFTLMEKQLQAATRDGEEKIGEILGHFFDLSAALSEHATKFSEEEFSGINGLLGELIEKLQFFDAHSQRLGHVAKTLNYASLKLDVNKSESEALVEHLRNLYSTTEERAVHQSLLSE